MSKCPKVAKDWFFEVLMLIKGKHISTDASKLDSVTS